MADRSVTLDILARDKASAAFNSAARSANRTEGIVSKVGKSMARVGKIAALGLAAGIGLGVVALKGFVNEARESERVGRLTESIIKSTGKSAKISAKEVGELATAVSMKTGIDDEAIQTGSNLLLTFKNIRNEVGRGNKIFNEATRAAVDLSAAGFGSIESASKMLGKALNDPIKGVTALGRAGVTFSDAQKKQIEQYVKHGNILKAQNLIMKEVKSQVGGAAAATATATDKMKVAFGNVAEEVGTALLPAIDRIAGWITTKALPAISEALPKIKAKFGEWKTAAEDAFATAKVKLGPIVAQIRTSIASAFKFGSEVATAINQGDWAAVGKAFGDALSKAASGAEGLSRAFRAWIARVDWLALGKAASAAAVPFIIGFTNDLATNFVKFVKSNPVDALVFVTSIIPFGRAAGILEKLLGRLPIVGPILRSIKGAGGAVESAFGGVFKGVVRAIEFIAPSAVAAVRRMGNRIVFRIYSLAVDAGAAAGRAGRTILSKLTAPFAGIADKLFSAGASLISGFVRGIVSKIGSVKDTLTGLTGKLTSWKGPPEKDRRLLRPAGILLMEGLVDGIKMGSQKVKDALTKLTDDVKTKLSTLRDSARDIASSVAGSVKNVVDISAFGAAIVTPGAVDPVTGETGPETSRTPSITETASGFASNAKAFVAALAAMARKKLAPSIIAAVAAAGPVSGLTAANAFAGASTSEVASVNASMGQIDALAKQAGQTVLKTTRLPADIKREEATLDELRAIRRHLEAKDGEVEFKVKGDDLYVWLKRVEKKKERRA